MPRTKSKKAAPASHRGYSAPALEKGIDIIESLAAAESGLTISEISLRLGRPMSELFRIIIVMERRGWLQKDPETACYSVTYNLLKLAHLGTPANSLSLAAASVMHELATKISQSCHLVVLSGTQALIVLRQENPMRHANLAVRVGAAISLTTSCSGHVLLAFLPETDRNLLLRSLPQPWGISREKLFRKLQRIRSEGCEVQQSPVTAGVTDISFPVRGLDGTVVAALTIPYLHVLDKSLPTTIPQARRALGDAAHRISQSLGFMS